MPLRLSLDGDIDEYVSDFNEIDNNIDIIVNQFKVGYELYLRFKLRITDSNTDKCLLLLENVDENEIVISSLSVGYINMHDAIEIEEGYVSRVREYYQNVSIPSERIQHTINLSDILRIYDRRVRESDCINLIKFIVRHSTGYVVRYIDECNGSIYLSDKMGNRVLLGNTHKILDVIMSITERFNLYNIGDEPKEEDIEGDSIVENIATFGYTGATSTDYDTYRRTTTSSSGGWVTLH